ncbi:hypothetical protein FQA39_LY16365 [Lamprigera yunnana]|nr:hypothetical protein FQA39_LY16365 [Lamprigera yunnana]
MWIYPLLAIFSLSIAASDDDYLYEIDVDLIESAVHNDDAGPTRNGRLFDFDRYPGFENPPKNSYDFIVVGSGSAGAALANRLTEIKKWNVLLLETGTVPTIITEVPALSAMWVFTNYNWGYLMEKQANFCLGLTDELMNWPRGKVLGGTSVINYNIHVRGNRHDYDRWEAMGNSGWSYRDLLQYFLKSEDSSVEYHDSSYHQTGGYLSVQDVSFRTKSAHAFVRAAQEVGYEYVDYNGKSQMGVSYVQATTRRGKRCSAEKAYLRVNRPNLTILTNSRVTKVLIDPTTKAAYGVEYIRNKRYHTARASKEVVLSAGALNSPQLLILSGIGPEGDLKELNIPVLQNLPVGQKLYDHITFLGLIFKVNESIVLQESLIYKSSSLVQFLLEGSGPLTALGGVEAVAYLKTNESTYSENYPNIELLFIGGGLQTDRGRIFRKMFRVNDKVYNGLWKKFEDSFAFSILPVLFHPKSYGYLKLKSKNPFKWPKFYGNYLTDQNGEDLRAFLSAIREAQKIAQAPAFKRYGVEQVSTPIPGCEQHLFDTDNYWECAIRHVTVTLHHQVATCKMGPSNDPEAVVDPKLRVYGIRNLRVADTSIIPTPVSAHTNVPAYMVGEKAADLIKEDWINNKNSIHPKFIRDVQ